MEVLKYWKKQEKPLFSDLAWNIPEQKTGVVTIVGGNGQNFSTAVRTSESLMNEFPIKTVKLVLPDSLRGKIPPLENIIFTPATTAGSFDKSMILKSAVQNSDFNLLIGDFSKNSLTAVAIIETIKGISSPLLITRDTLDLVINDSSELITHPDLFIFASMPQLQKLFKALYYPKMLLLAMPLMPVVEVLHKFTLSYPATIITLHQNQIIVAKDGEVVTTPLEKTEFSPLLIWSGKLAMRIVAFNLYNPKKPLEATVAALIS